MINLCKNRRWGNPVWGIDSKPFNTARVPSNVSFKTAILKKMKAEIQRMQRTLTLKTDERRQFCDRKTNMRFCAHALFLPTFLFIVAQIVSICGAFETLAAYDADGINDMSLEDIVFIDPFLRSHSDTKTVAVFRTVSSGGLISLIKLCLPVLLNEPVQSLQERPARIAYREPPANLWLSNRVLRI